MAIICSCRGEALVVAGVLRVDGGGPTASSGRAVTIRLPDDPLMRRGRDSAEGEDETEHRDAGGVA